MKVKLIAYDDLKHIDHAIGLCWNAGDYEEPKCSSRIQRVALQNRHGSVLEFVNFTFDIEASTKVLLEMTRHRHCSYAVKSTRYCLSKDLRNEDPFLSDDSMLYNNDQYERAGHFLELSGDFAVDRALILQLELIRQCVLKNIPNDVTSTMLPQAWKYEWTCKFNARSLKNFFDLRRAPTAHQHIRDVANAMFEVIPDTHKFLFEEVIKNE